MKEKINQILENQIQIMEELWRNTSFPSLADNMKKAIVETKKLLNQEDENDD